MSDNTNLPSVQAEDDADIQAVQKPYVRLEAGRHSPVNVDLANSFWEETKLKHNAFLNMLERRALKDDIKQSKYLGHYVDLDSLIAAIPEPTPGDYADVDAGEGSPVVRYIWDETDQKWEAQVGVSTQLTGEQIKELYEGEGNVNSFTDAEKEKLDNLGSFGGTFESYEDLVVNADYTKLVEGSYAIVDPGIDFDPILYIWDTTGEKWVPTVGLSGDQTFDGIKTFSSFPVTPSAAPTANYQAANKKYVDDSVIGANHALFVKPVRYKPLLEKTGVTSVKIPAGLNAVVGSQLVALSADITLSLDVDLVGSTAVAGTDYFVYLKDDATAYISASDTEPDGRLIAGFHYGLTGHTETPSGNKTEADMVKLRGINAHTFWDLTFRANKWTNRGLTFDGINWIDIYLADEEYAVRGWSKAGGWIAGGTIEYGRKFPIIPEMYGGNGSATYGKLTPFVAWDMLNAAGMEPISYKQFAHAMYGVEEGLQASGIETVVGKIEHYPRLTSRLGVEQATGVQWIWGADFGSSSSGTWNNIADGRGQVYSGVQVVLLGARRDSAAGQPGSRAPNWNYGLARSIWSFGVRGLRDHLNLD